MNTPVRRHIPAQRLNQAGAYSIFKPEAAVQTARGVARGKQEQRGGPSVRPATPSGHRYSRCACTAAPSPRSDLVRSAGRFSYFDVQRRLITNDPVSIIMHTSLRNQFINGDLPSLS